MHNVKERERERERERENEYKYGLEVLSAYTGERNISNEMTLPAKLRSSPHEFYLYLHVK